MCIRDRVYYNSDQFEHVLEYLVPLFPSPYAFYERLGNYYEDQELFGIGFKREARYEVLRTFCREHIKDVEVDLELLDSLLNFDYYLRENAKSRPMWCKEEPIEKSLYQGFFKNAGNEEYRFEEEGYDSKIAARMMHIEPISGKAIMFMKESIINKNTILDKQTFDKVYCLFDYEKRNPLSKDASVILLTHL